MVKKTVSLAHAKSRLSDLVLRAAYAGEEFVITRRGRPAAVLGPLPSGQGRSDLADVTGWLADGDPLFRSLEETRGRSRRRGPRALSR